MWKIAGEFSKGNESKRGCSNYLSTSMRDPETTIHEKESEQLSPREKVRTKTGGAASLNGLECEEKQTGSGEEARCLEEWRQGGAQINYFYLWLLAWD